MCLLYTVLFFIFFFASRRRDSICALVTGVQTCALPIFDCAIRVGNLPDSTLIAKRIGPIYGKLVASPDYVKRCGSPRSPDEVEAHQALMQGTEAWRFMDGDKKIGRAHV